MEYIIICTGIGLVLSYKLLYFRVVERDNDKDRNSI